MAAPYTLLNSSGTGNWASAQFGGTSPIVSHAVVIQAGHTITIADRQPVCGRCVVRGTLKVSRTVNSALLIGQGSLVLDGGTLDIGQMGDRVTALFDLDIQANESILQSGTAFAPDGHPNPMPAPDLAATLTATTGGNGIYNSDVGIFTLGNSNIYIHGVRRDTWTKMTASAAAGAASIVVDGTWTEGWAVGDLLTIAPSNLKTSSASQAERRRIRAITGVAGDATRTITLGDPADLGSPPAAQTLTNAHNVYAGANRLWTDFYGDANQETLAPAVGNLTSNIRFRATNAVMPYEARAAVNNNRPHIMIMGSTHWFVEDLAIENFSPLILPNPADEFQPTGRYAWHAHHLKALGAGSYNRRMRIYGDLGVARHWGVSNHETWDVEYTDTLVNAMGSSNASGSRAAPNGIVMESTVTGLGPPDGFFQDANDVRLVRPCVITVGFGTNGSNLGDTAGIWLGLGVASPTKSVCYGPYVCDVDGPGNNAAGIIWPQFNAAQSGPAIREGDSTKIPGVKLEVHSCRTIGQRIANNNPAFPDGRKDIVDELIWHCNGGGEEHGRYTSSWWQFRLRTFDNGGTQNFHTAVGRGVTNFLADCQNLDTGAARSGIDALSVGTYVVPSAAGTAIGEDSVYEAGVVRNIHGSSFAYKSQSTLGTGAPTHIQFADVNFNSHAIRYGDPDSGSTGVHPHEGFPPFHDISLAVCGNASDKNGGFGSSSYTRVRRGIGIADANMTLFHKDDDNLGPGTLDSTYGAVVEKVIESTNARTATPRVIITSPADGATVPANGIQAIAITADTSAGVDLYDAIKDREVEIASWTQAQVAAAGGALTFNYDTTGNQNRYGGLIAQATKAGTHPTGSGRSLVIDNYSLAVTIKKSISAGGPPPPPEPTNPQLTSVSSTSTSLTWNWADVLNEVGYELSYKRAIDSIYTIAGTTGINAVTFTAGSLSLWPNTVHDLRAASIGSTGTRYQSSPLQTTTPQIIPAPMISPGAENVAATTADIFATDNSQAGAGTADESGFDARYALLADGPPWTDIAPDLVASAGIGTKKTWSLTGLTSGAVYKAEMWSKNSAGNAVAVTVQFTTNTTPPEPTAPTLSTVTSPAPTSITATWTNVANEAGFRMQSSPSGAGTWTDRVSVGADVLTATWTTAAPNTAYDIRAGSVGSGINFFPSSSLPITTAVAAPAAPTSPQFSVITEESVRFTVIDASGAAGDAETAFLARYRIGTNPWTQLTNQPALSGTGGVVVWDAGGLDANTLYEFEAWATNATGDSAHVSASVTTQPPPSEPLFGNLISPRVNIVTIGLRRLGPGFWDRIHGLGGF